MFPDNSLERQDKPREYYERTDEEIAESNQAYNDHFNSLLSGHELNSEDITNSMTAEARANLGMDASLIGSGTEGFKEGVEDASNELTSTDASEPDKFSRDVEIAKNEVMKILSPLGLDEVDHKDAAERTMGAKFEELANDESSESEFLSQRRQDELENALVAEQAVKSFESGDTEAIELAGQSEAFRGIIQKSKEYGGVNKLSNVDLAEVGRDIRNRNLTFEQTIEEAPQNSEQPTELSEYQETPTPEETEANDSQSSEGMDEPNEVDADWQKAPIDNELLKSRQDLIIEDMIKNNRSKGTREDYDLAA